MATLYYLDEEQDDWNWNQWDWHPTIADNRNSYRQERRYDNTENNDSESTNVWQTWHWSDQDWRTSQSCWLPDRCSNDTQDKVVTMTWSLLVSASAILVAAAV